jgi:hypothetical protein
MNTVFMGFQLPNICKTEYFLRMSVITLAFITPIIFLVTEGYLPSISNYWRTPLQPLFIISNASTSYYFFESHNRWRIPAVFLLMLTAFSVDSYPLVHNILAIIFFVSCLIPLYKTKHYKMFFWAYVCSVLFMPISITLGEFLSISVLCIFHGLMINKIYKIKKK